MLSELEQKIRKWIIEKIKTGNYDETIIRYGTLASEFKLPLDTSHDRNQVFKILDDINRPRFPIYALTKFSPVRPNYFTGNRHGLSSMLRATLEPLPGQKGIINEIHPAACVKISMVRAGLAHPKPVIGKGLESRIIDCTAVAQTAGTENPLDSPYLKGV